MPCGVRADDDPAYVHSKMRRAPPRRGEEGTAMTRPLPELQRIAGEVDRYQDIAEVHEAMDRVEFVFELLDPQLQDLANALMERLRQRLEQLNQG